MQIDTPLFSLAGKTILVAGASKGIGFAIAEAMTLASANVVGCGRSESVSSPLFKYEPCDIQNRIQFTNLVDACITQHGSIDAYFHVAGVTKPSIDAFQDPALFEVTLQNNLISAYACCIEVGKKMAHQLQGSIVTVTSIGSMLAFPDNPGYVASKGGLRMMTKALALDLGKYNIRANSLVPGYIHTEMTDASYNNPVMSAERTSRTMLNRWGQPSDLAGAAIFLASNASSYVTGTDLVVDGGWIAKGL